MATMTAPAPSFTIGLCQVLVGDDKAANLATARDAIARAAGAGAHVVVLPECFNSPYDTKQFPRYAETVPETAAGVDREAQPTTAALLECARANSVFLIAGSMPELAGGKYYNTSLAISAEGDIVGRHRKVHLFDIDVPGRITFRESDVLSGGDQVSVFQTPYCKIGVGICYDIRFPELSLLMRRRGADVLVFPGAFNMTTGPAHWELLQRARAVDSQCYVATVSPARNPESSYQAWGHSTVVDPWGELVATTEHHPDIVVAPVYLEKVQEMRRNIPTFSQRRHDVYELEDRRA